MALVGYRVKRLSLPRALRLDAHLLPGDASANLFENITVDYVEVHDDRDPSPSVPPPRPRQRRRQPAAMHQSGGCA